MSGSLPRPMQEFRGELVRAAATKRKNHRRASSVGWVVVTILAAAAMSVGAMRWLSGDDNSGSTSLGTSGADSQMTNPSDIRDEQSADTGIVGSRGGLLVVTSAPEVEQSSGRHLTVYRFVSPDGIEWGLTHDDDCPEQTALIVKDGHALGVVPLHTEDFSVTVAGVPVQTERWETTALPFVVFDASVSTASPENVSLAPELEGRCTTG